MTLHQHQSRHDSSLIVTDLLLTLVAVSWGTTYWVAKGLVSHGEVLAMLSVRMTATGVLLALALIVARRSIPRKVASLGILYGVILASVFAFETFGIANTTATNAGLVISLTIVLTPVLEAAVTRARLSATYTVGGVAAVFGVVLLSLNGQLSAPSLGDWLVLVAALLRAIHVIVVKRTSASTSVDSLGLTFVQMATCALVFTAASFIFGGSPAQYFGSLGQGGGWSMTYLVVVCTVFPFFIQMWAVRRTSASRVSLLLGTEPIWAALVGVTLAGDKLRIEGWIGLAIVLGAIAMVHIVTARTHRWAPETPRSSPSAQLASARKSRRERTRSPDVDPVR